MKIKQPRLVAVPKANCWRLAKEWRFTYKNCPRVVPKGFLTDKASIPRFFWRLVGHPATPRIEAPSLAHDAAYYPQNYWGMSRKEADKMFLDMMLHQNAESPYIKYFAVRLFGWGAWYNHPHRLDALSGPKRALIKAGIRCLELLGALPKR